MPDIEAPAATSARLAIAAEVRAEIARQRKPMQAIAEVLGLNSRQSVHQRLHGEIAFRAEELVLLAADLGVPVERFMPAPVVTAEVPAA